MPRWGRERYQRPALALARSLVGALLIHRTRGGLRVARIIETEAYTGPRDRASHARHGRTQRNHPLFSGAGLAYVHLIYGVWNCLDVTAGKAQSVLLRGIELPGGQRLHGPGRLCRAMDIGLDLNGLDLCRGPLWIESLPGSRTLRLEKGPRQGVAYAGEWASKTWRFMERKAVMKKTSKPPKTQTGGRLVSADEAGVVGLDDVDAPEADPDEVQAEAGDAPEQDAPADDAVREQEEYYEGMSSESLPSGKREDGKKRSSQG